MSKVSVIIPSRNEQFLQPTIKDILSNATGDIEVIAVLDGYWPIPQLENDSRLIQIHRGKAMGMRAAINAGVAASRGEFIMKCDAHCMFGNGFDEILTADMQDDWVVVPRRKRLDAENWRIQNVGKPDIDYMYLSYPDPNAQDWGGPGLFGRDWVSKNRDPKLKDVLIDDLMSAQGSCWFMKKDYFHFLELMDEEHYSTFWKEMQEVGLKCWLSGGRMIVNKKTWYAHLHKGTKYGRGYSISRDGIASANTYTNKWFYEEKVWHKQIYPLRWLIKRFWPVPTWPDEYGH